MKSYINLLFSKLTSGYVSILAIKNGCNPKTYVVSLEDKDVLESVFISLSKEKYNVYVCPNVMSKKPSKGRGGENDFSIQTSIVLDIDTLGGTHKNSKSKTYCPSKEEAINLLPVKPSLIVDTGYGIQVYYVFETPIQIDSFSKDRNIFFTKRVEKIFKEHGYSGVDHTWSLDHVFRVPGTINFKSTPVPCKIISSTDIRLFYQILTRMSSPMTGLARHRL